MAKRYLKDGDIVYSTGCYLAWDAERNVYVCVSQEDDAYYDGELVETCAETGLPYIEKDIEKLQGVNHEEQNIQRDG